nr:site-2 protease family protein [Kofleriaceae bacterium]
GVPTSAIELNGLGGLCFFARPLPPDRLTNIVVLLAGPAANLLLWLIFAAAGASTIGPSSENPYSINRTARLFLQLASINQLLFFFNLLPAHPLDGGRALAQFISASIGNGRAMRVIAYLGLVLALLLCLASFKGGLFVALIGLVLFQENLSVLQAYKGQQ